MEDGLGPEYLAEVDRLRKVLILVLMEDGLGPLVVHTQTELLRLNPCFNGRWSRTLRATQNLTMMACLNPCFNGRWSRTVESITFLII